MERKNTSSGAQNKSANGKSTNFTSDNCKSTRNNIQMVDSEMNNSNNSNEENAGRDILEHHAINGNKNQVIITGGNVNNSNNITNNYYGLNADDVRLLLTMIRQQQEQIDKLMSLLNVEMSRTQRR